jgi:hypothetical protein
MAVDPVSMPSMLATLAGTIRSHGLLILAIAACILFAGLAAMKRWMREDVAEGRALPSGAKQ